MATLLITVAAISLYVGIHIGYRAGQHTKAQSEYCRGYADGASALRLAEFFKSRS